MLRLLEWPHVEYLLAALLKIGSRIVSSPAAERARLEAHGSSSGRVQEVDYASP
jgi:hypothetical protein